MPHAKILVHTPPFHMYVYTSNLSKTPHPPHQKRINNLPLLPPTFPSRHTQQRVRPPKTPDPTTPLSARRARIHPPIRPDGDNGPMVLRPSFIHADMLVEHDLHGGQARGRDAALMV